MKIQPIFAGLPWAAAFLCLSGLSHAQVLFIERFEQPAIAADSFLEIPTGTRDFDNPGWAVTNVAPIGVFIDNNFLFSGGQVLAFGGNQSPLGNQLEREISGFSGTLLPQISFDYFKVGIGTQGVSVQVFDPFDSNALLYSASYSSTGKVVDAPFSASPVGDSILLRISQTGNTSGSDSAIDNIRVAAAIPEPSVALIGTLGLLAGLLRRRR